MSISVRVSKSPENNNAAGAPVAGTTANRVQESVDVSGPFRTIPLIGEAAQGNSWNELLIEQDSSNDAELRNSTLEQLQSFSAKRRNDIPALYQPDRKEADSNADDEVVDSPQDSSSGPDGPFSPKIGGGLRSNSSAAISSGKSSSTDGMALMMLMIEIFNALRNGDLEAVIANLESTKKELQTMLDKMDKEINSQKDSTYLQLIVIGMSCVTLISGAVSLGKTGDYAKQIANNPNDAARQLNMKNEIEWHHQLSQTLGSLNNIGQASATFGAGFFTSDAQTARKEKEQIDTIMQLLAQMRSLILSAVESCSQAISQVLQSYSTVASNASEAAKQAARA